MPSPELPIAPGVLLPLAAGAVAALIVLVSIVRLHAFVALSIVALAFGLAAGLPPLDVIRAFQDGVGATLASVALVIALGAVLGALLAESGGAQLVARAVVGRIGRKLLPWAAAAIGFVLGTPVFFTVGLVLLVPVVREVAATARIPVLLVAVPLVAGLSASHGLVPPHPGPVVAIGLLGADVGRTLAYAIPIAAAATIAAGPVFALAVVPRLRRAAVAEQSNIPVPLLPPQAHGARQRGAGLTATVIIVILPVLLMLVGAIADASLATGPIRRAADFVGNPLTAMLVTVGVALREFGHGAGLDRRQLLALVDRSLAPVAAILLVVAAGGGFGRVLDHAGVGRMLAAGAVSFNLSPLVLGWVIAALLRVSVGSATVAITTTAGLVAPMLGGMPGTNRELLVLSIGAGSLIASHVNDGGFWLVKEYLDLTVAETFATWTVLETIVAAAGLAGVLALDWMVA